jgi:RND family efflux transporter MFP subunit
MASTFSWLHFARRLAICGLWIGLASSSPGTEIQGFTEPYQDIDVAAADMGIVETITVKEGDRVTEDQILVRMDAAVLEVTLEIAKSIKESRGQLESAIEELELQTKMVGKLAELRARQHASRQELERAQAQMRIAQARLKSVQEELKVKTLEHERARVQLERRRLRSPINGIVTRIMKARGESVLLNDPVILKVVQLDPLLVIFLVPAEQARALTNGNTVNVRIAEPAQVTPGKVEFVSPTTDPQSGLTRVRVRVPNPEERLPCGTTCYLILSDKSPSRRVATDR